VRGRGEGGGGEGRGEEVVGFEGAQLERFHDGDLKCDKKVIGLFLD
jgi:hypothetical protein